jgi:hypothetical protein
VATPFAYITTKEYKINFKMLKKYDNQVNANVCVCDGSNSTIGAQSHYPKREIPL